jgi:hypothetical protein
LWQGSGHARAGWGMRSGASFSRLGEARKDASMRTSTPAPPSSSPPLPTCLSYPSLPRASPPPPTVRRSPDPHSPSYTLALHPIPYHPLTLGHIQLHSRISSSHSGHTLVTFRSHSGHFRRSVPVPCATVVPCFRAPVLPCPARHRSVAPHRARAFVPLAAVI